MRLAGPGGEAMAVGEEAEAGDDTEVEPDDAAADRDASARALADAGAEAARAWADGPDRRVGDGPAHRDAAAHGPGPGPRDAAMHRVDELRRDLEDVCSEPPVAPPGGPALLPGRRASPPARSGPVFHFREATAGACRGRPVVRALSSHRRRLGSSPSPTRCWLKDWRRSAATRNPSGRCASDWPPGSAGCTRCAPCDVPPRRPSARKRWSCPAPTRRSSCRRSEARTSVDGADSLRMLTIVTATVSVTVTGSGRGAGARRRLRARVLGLFAEPPRAPPGLAPSGTPRISRTWCWWRLWRKSRGRCRVRARGRTWGAAISTRSCRRCSRLGSR